MGDTLENVCRTCLDTGCILLDELEDDHSFYKSEPCPDCTPPENVDSHGKT